MTNLVCNRHTLGHRSVSVLRRYMVVCRSVSIEPFPSCRSGKGFPLGEAGKKGTSEPFLTEEGTQVLIFSLVCNFHCSTLYPPVCALGPAFYGIPATGRYKYPSSLRYPPGESLGAPAPVHKMLNYNFHPQKTTPSGSQRKNDYCPDSSRTGCGPWPLNYSLPLQNRYRARPMVQRLPPRLCTL